MGRPKTIMVDLDGVICTEESFFDRPLSEPIAGARVALRKLRAAGHTVVIYTGRGWGEYRGTKRWLDEHGFEYDGLHMGKPIADVWIDDRAIRFTSWPEALKQLDGAPRLAGKTAPSRAGRGRGKTKSAAAPRSAPR